MELSVDIWDLRKQLIEQNVVITKLKKDYNVLNSRFLQLQESSRMLHHESTSQQKEIQTLRTELLTWRDKAARSILAQKHATEHSVKKSNHIKSLLSENGLLKEDIGRLQNDISHLKSSFEKKIKISSSLHEKELRESQSREADSTALLHTTELKLQNTLINVNSLETERWKLIGRISEADEERSRAFAIENELKVLKHDHEALEKSNQMVKSSYKDIMQKLRISEHENKNLLDFMLQEGIQVPTVFPSMIGEGNGNNDEDGDDDGGGGGQMRSSFIQPSSSFKKDNAAHFSYDALRDLQMCLRDFS